MFWLIYWLPCSLLLALCLMARRSSVVAWRTPNWSLWLQLNFLVWRPPVASEEEAVVSHSFRLSLMIVVVWAEELVSDFFCSLDFIAFIIVIVAVMGATTNQVKGFWKADEPFLMWRPAFLDSWLSLLVFILTRIVGHNVFKLLCKNLNMNSSSFHIFHYIRLLF